MRRSSLACLALLLCCAVGRSAEAPVEVDVALVLAVDVSLSMTAEEQLVQRSGYVEAFRSAVVQRAVGLGQIGRIAVTYVEWAGVGNQRVVVPWTLIGSPEEAASFAERLAQSPPRRSTWTSIASAIDFSVGLLSHGGFAPLRRVIDVSGDGPNNQGRPVTRARDDAVDRGITINGLPLMIREPSGPWDIKDLDLYYRDCVIGGPGSFMIPVREREQFAEAIRVKIVREVAERGAAAPLRRTQAASPTNCLVGDRPSPDWD
ncbi:protein of unknown function DUF1194 [Methylobacterium sp. 4-46]|uniref:DUF1194 domain-containing protein n=1 Tax=unclassified Methylobacterium TaxID=2615210 RepID=UPI000152CF8A|nr:MULTISPECIES: DUF1194 domain-containing protein [Methylobacterium]ACA18763.1 protein of unknown function DUF1194 [Methylobacterium sp. 4-46]WFT77993.1 DUF1194 domain-containing protein [Methylobacterium nodulans]